MENIVVYNGIQAGLLGSHLLRYFVCWKSICTPLAFSKLIIFYPHRQQRFGRSSREATKMVAAGALALWRETDGDGLVQPGWIQVNLTEPPVAILESLWGDRFRPFRVEHDKRIQDFGYKLKQEMSRLRFYLSICLYRMFSRIASWELRLLSLHLKERKTRPGFITIFWVVASCPGIPT